MRIRPTSTRRSTTCSPSSLPDPFPTPRTRPTAGFVPSARSAATSQSRPRGPRRRETRNRQTLCWSRCARPNGRRLMTLTRWSAAGLPDGAARDEIRTALEVTLLVEAGAGSGKTTMLVDRMLALLAAGKARPENLAAVTFTRKAASHLRRRFQSALEAAAWSEKNALRKRRIDEARGALDRLTLGTIDSFCALLLSERPLEAGIDPAALRVELQEAALFRARTFREYVGTLADVPV